MLDTIHAFDQKCRCYKCYKLYIHSFLLLLKSNVVDLQERIPVDEVFRELNCTKEGLTNDEGQKRLEVFGPNKLEEKKVIINPSCN